MGRTCGVLFAMPRTAMPALSHGDACSVARRCPACRSAMPGCFVEPSSGSTEVVWKSSLCRGYFAPVLGTRMI